jgi:hypothetical protein
MKQYFPITTLILLLALGLTSSKTKPGKNRSIYQLTVIHYQTTDQEKILDDYLQNALLPALHRHHFKNIGVFKRIAQDTSANKTLYIFIPHQSLQSVVKIAEQLKTDAVYQKDGAAYLNAVYNNPPYTRIETILLQAFALAPEMQLPDLKNERRERVYELRSYESSTEKIFANKVHMFNEGDEIGLFKNLHFNAAFYGEVIAGSKMPNLMYMTCHENRAARDSNWKNFSASEQWKKLSSAPEYQHNVSHIDIDFLYPTDYSDF